jgi:predicted ATPase/signal transduction histidine kinase
MGPFPDDYVVVEELYRSGRSVVSRARRGLDPASVVIKQPAPGLPENVARARFAHEAAMRRGLDPRWALQVLDHSDLRLVLEDFGGRSLQQIMKGSRLSLERALELACGLTETLAGVHRAGVLHGDVHPGNFIYNESTGCLKISDFDLSLRVESGGQVADSLIQGNLSYVAPERTGRLNVPVSYPSDLYSLGVTLYQLFTGRLPFESDDPLRLVHSHLALEPEPMTSVDAKLPAGLSNIVQRLLRKEPGQRYQTADGLHHDLLQCQVELQSLGEISDFSLGSGDRPNHFELPGQLYGRERHCEQLRAALERAEQGGCQVVLVAGPSGVGKSSLVRRAAAPASGYFLTGKFDQLSSEKPCSALMEALDQLALQLLTENEDRLEQWRARLYERLEGSLGLLVQHVPGLASLVGPQPPPPPVASAAAQGRFLAAFQQLLQLFASSEHPLVLFLDDLQWADALTVRLLTQLATSPESRGLLLVLAYRDQELTRARPFCHALSQFSAAVRVELAPLTSSEVLQLLTDCLRCPFGQLEELSRVVIEKTEGNPFFVRQFLQSLYSEGHLSYSAKLGGFSCNLDKVRAASITENVADLLAHKLERLPAETLRLLRLAAALGNRFHLATLRSISDQDLEAELRPALEMGLILAAQGSEATYKFQHDRVQRAAYEGLPPEQRPALHSEIGRMLLARLAPESLEERLLEVVGHLNRAECQPEDRAAWAALNLRAGDKAREAAAYDLACTCYRAAAGLQDWTEDADLTYRTHYQLSESLRLNAQLGEAMEVLEDALLEVQDPCRQAELEGLRMNLYHSQGHMDKALGCIRKAAQLLGVELPKNPGGCIQSEIQNVLEWAESGRVERLLRLPELQDARLATVMEVLTWATPIAFQAEPALGALITLKLVALSLEHGNSLHSARAYCVLYRVLEWYDEPEVGYRFACVGRHLNSRRQESQARSAIEFTYAYFIGPWNQAWSDILVAFRRSWDQGLASGDYQHMAYSGIFEIFAALLGGRPLPQVVTQAETCLRTCHQLGEANKASYLEAVLQVVQQMRGQRKWERPSLGATSASLMMRFTLHCAELVRAFHAEDETGVVSSLAAMRPLLPSCWGFLTEVFYYLYGGLGAASRADLETLQESLEWMRSRRCQANFAAPTCLLQAEMHRLRNEILEASDLYDQAIALAGKYGLLGLEAQANQLAGQFWMRRGKNAFASHYLRTAHRLYQHWGAGALAGALELRYNAFFSNRMTGASCSATQTSDLLDYASLARATQAISGEIVLDRLLSTLTELLIENAGAQTGALILEQERGWEVCALRTVESAPVEVVSGLPLRRAPISQGVVQFVLRTGQKVVLTDARLHSAFANDDYVRSRNPRSVLCAPIRHKGRLLGALYLENNLLVGAFDEQRLSGLEILLAQVGVSLENARLFARERQQAEVLEELVSHRTRELRQANERLHDEIVNRERMENEMRLGQKLQAVGQLAAGVAHEINTPMQYIQDNLTFVREVSEKWQGLDEDSSEVPEALDAALEGVRRVTAIVRAMKAFSYPDQSERALVDLNVAIENTLLVARNEYKLVADVVTEFQPLPACLCFGGELNQVVLNLVVNAAHAIEETGQRGTIRVGTRVEGEAIVVEVADNGSGIPQEVQARIFDPFFTTKDVGKGTGQGLAIARSAVERQGGQLSFLSATGAGTTFTIRLPLR